MYNIMQYVSAAIHDGAINHQTIIDRYKDVHKASTIELGIDEEKIYEEAKKVKKRKKIMGLLMIIPAIFIITALTNYKTYHRIDNDIFTAVLVSLLFIAIALFIEQIYVNSYIKKLSTADVETESNNKQNAIISGGYSPFTGYGNDLNSWSFTLNIKKSDQFENNTPQNINIKELLDYISTRVKRNINNIEISDKIFVNGKDIRKNKIFMKNITSKPNVHVSADIINENIEKKDKDIRHYRVLTMPMWNGQMYLSVFLRFTLTGKQLFVESRFFLLYPLKDKLMLLDNAFSKSGFSYYFSLAFISLFKSLYSWVYGPLLLLEFVSKIHIAIFGDPENKLKRKNETYNYGDINSLRESWSTNKYQRYFQMLDKDQNYKIVQHIIINSLVDYLKSKGISTEDIKERQTTIFNSGMIITGGTVQTNQMAVGIGAMLKNKINIGSK